jgi:HSP20 family protein
MKLVQRQPVGASPFADMERMFDTFFGGTGARSQESGGGRWMPAMDVQETEEAVVLTADLPGMSEDDIEIEVSDGVLSISGERRDERSEEAEGGFRRVERSFGRFSRSMRLPRDTDPEKVTADFDRGVLKVRIAKPESRKPHRVSIGAGAGERSAKTIEGEATDRS